MEMESEQNNQTDLSDFNQCLKDMEQYDKFVNSKTEFFSTQNPDLIENIFVKYLRNKENVEPVLSKKKYKIRFTRNGQDELNKNQSDDVEICLKILRLEKENKCCVKFTKLKGQHSTFLRLCNEYINDNNCLKSINDAMC